MSPSFPVHCPLIACFPSSFHSFPICFQFAFHLFPACAHTRSVPQVFRTFAAHVPDAFRLCVVFLLFVVSAPFVIRLCPLCFLPRCPCPVRVLFVFRSCSLHVPSVFRACFSHALQLFPDCSMIVFRLSSIQLLCSIVVPPMFHQCSAKVPSVFVCCPPVIRKRAMRVPCMFRMCSVRVPFFVHAPSVLGNCSVYFSIIPRPCTMNVPFVSRQFSINVLSSSIGAPTIVSQCSVNVMSIIHPCCAHVPFILRLFSPLVALQRPPRSMFRAFPFFPQLL